MADRDEQEDIWAALKEDDFRGKTNFRELTVEQRLQWLSNAAAFTLEARRARAAKDTVD